MNREEAIKVLEKQFDKSCGNYRYQNVEKLDFEDALWVAISALRQQEHFREVTKKVEPLTNAQKIRAMTDEELADFLNQWGTSTRAWQKDPGETLYWLQQTAGEEDKHEP